MTEHALPQHRIAPRTARDPLLPAAPPDPGTLSTGDFLTGWLAGRRTLRPATRVAYEIHLRRHLLPRLGDIPLAALTRSDVQEMYDELLDAPGPRRLSPTTVRRVHATLTGALNTAVRRGLLERNPAAFVELPRAEHVRLQVWDATELTIFLDATAADPLHPLLLLMALTGLRRGEAIGLRWDNVELHRSQIRVEQQITAIGAHRHVGPPKTSNGRRTIAITTRLTQTLQWHAARQRLARHTAGAAWIDTGLVFTTDTGAALDPAHVSREFERLTRAAAVPVIRLHDLRHTSASLGLASGETLLEVSRRLGHSSITITADIYSHIAPATARSSADRLAQLIASTTPPVR